MINKICFSLLLLFSSFGRAEQLKQGYSIDPSLGFSTVETRGQSADSRGFFWRGEREGLEVSVRGTTLDSVQEARELSNVEFNNIANLYGKRGNPYEGQISSLVSCDKIFQPKPSRVKVQGVSRPALLVGANSRKSFGACTADQIAYWAAYYNYVDEESKTVFSVRIFKKMSAPSAKQIAEANRDLTEIAAKVLTKAVK
ncbi:MAG: hypothetical protein KF799_04830 [Bdellovibrionales bacterium]|nr:hypothetical protein [Bdellovibrionales bacterium]